MPHLPTAAHCETPTRRVGVLTLPGFSLLAQASALEPLLVANRLSGRPLYAVEAFTPAGRAVASQATLSLAPGQPLEALPTTLDMALLCAAAPQEDAGAAASPALETALRAPLNGLARRGALLIGVGGGACLLARAGLLDGYRAALPTPSDAGARPDPIRRTRQLFEIDRDRLTCGGGTAALDMMTALVAMQHGHALAERVSQRLVEARLPRAPDSEATGRAPASHAPQALRDAVQLMAANIEEPLTTHELAAHLGISRRQLERLFKKHLQAVPGRYYLDLRLQEARRLLRDSQWPAGEIALKTGFSSPAHFSTAYRNHFGHSPREERL